ncbi:porin [Urechidicola vernalis]|uniref:Porin n=1 Tax=Urechidicola vernalis TaxID=3075600 RepID=A0ABU2Y391_9FLAO|nr:porin [Urechidicola sp. P050]MDT0552646.1 porin [Urechidicola sp. P050]
MKKILLSITILTICVTTNLQAQETEEKKKFSISGSIDAYFRTNFNAPNTGDNPVAPGTSFANLPGFALGMANLVAAYEGEKVGFVADLVYGPRGEDATFLSGALRPDGSSNIVNQLYAYWNVSENVTLTIGNFNTFLGYEVISPTGNFNYSTSYLFSYGPFSHTGIKADIALSENTSLMLSVMNPTDATEFNPTDTYAFGAQLGFHGQYLNLLIDHGAFEIDYTGGFDVSEKFFLGINAAYYSNGEDDPDDLGFYGAAIYPQYTTSEVFTIGLRAEYFQEIEEFGAIGTAMPDSSVFATTLTGNIHINDLTIIPEIRLDSSSDDFFVNKDLEGQKSLSSFVLAAVYSF